MSLFEVNIVSKQKAQSKHSSLFEAQNLINPHRTSLQNKPLLKCSDTRKVQHITEKITYQEHGASTNSTLYIPPREPDDILQGSSTQSL
jgi:hypothetical protein